MSTRKVAARKALACDDGLRQDNEEYANGCEGLLMRLSDLKVRMSGEQLMTIVSRYGRALKGIRIKSVDLDYGDVYVEGEASKGLATVAWNVRIRLDHTSSEIGLRIVDISVKGIGVVSLLARGFLFLGSGMKSRESWAAELVSRAVSKLGSSVNDDDVAYSYDDEVWIDICKLAERFGVSIEGAVAEFETRDNEIKFAIRSAGRSSSKAPLAKGKSACGKAPAMKAPPTKCRR